MKNKLLLILALISFNSHSQIKILFDATKAESAGSADWVIDADLHNLGFFNGPAVIGGTESNPQRFPSPPQSGITASTPENYWNGGISAWAVDCVKKGYQVESLPYNAAITYGVTTNPQDLSNYKVYIVDEPNILFTASQRDAIIQFVQNGGGLCMISDHDVSDRNNDTYDSPHIWNDLMTNNTLQANPFGITFDYANFSQTTSNVANLPTDPILHGTAGNVTQAKFSGGTTMTLNTTQNSSVKGLIFKSGASNIGITNVMIASATYQLGKVVAIGDSSIPDDGTGDPNDTLYDGYITDAAGNHQKLLMNATIWLASTTLGTAENSLSEMNIAIAPNPISNKELKLNCSNYPSEDALSITIFDAVGRIVKNIPSVILQNNNISIPLEELNSGIYFCKIYNATATKNLTFVIK